MHPTEIFKIEIIILIFFSITHKILVSGDIFPQCEDSNVHGIFIESEMGCDWYIYCDGENSYTHYCDSDSYFDQSTQTCNDKKLVQCPNEKTTTFTIATTPSIMPTTLNTIRQSSITATTTWPTTFGNDAISTSYFTNTSKPSSSSLLYWLFTTTTNATSNADALSSTVPPLNIVNRCPELDNPLEMIYLSHPKSCSDYFMCYHGKEISMHCSELLHFNSLTGKCDYPENVRCQPDLTLVKEHCKTHTTDFYSHPDNCNYYYFCKNGYLMLQQCPFFFGWDYEKRACAPLRLAKCYNKYNKQQQ